MVLESGFVMHGGGDPLYDIYNQQFINDNIEREIIYDTTDNVFTELQLYDGIVVIDNIYTEILPIHVELVRLKEEDMLIKDLKGRLTLLTVMPF